MSSTQKYRRKTLAFLYAVVFFLAGMESFAQDAESGITIEEIIDLGSTQLQPQSAHGIISVKNVSGERVETELVLEGYGRFDEGAKLLLVFYRPKAIRNTRFLALLPKGAESSQWIYLPSLRRVQRIIGSNQDASFMGTELLYSDIAERNYDQYDYRYVRDEILDGEDTWVMEITPKEQWTYGSMLEWISKDSYFPIKAEFFDPNGTLVKTSRTSEMRFIDGYWVPIYTEITNAVTGRKTIINIQKIEYNITIPDRYFSTAYLKQGS